MSVPRAAKRVKVSCPSTDGPVGTHSAPDADARRFFTDEIARLMDRLYGAALRLTRNPTDAEDLVAESVAKAWEAFPGLRDRGAFPAWMLRIVTNTFISRRRHERTVPETESSDAIADGSEDEFSLFRRLHQPFLLWWGTPEHAFLNKILREDIERALDRLPEHYRVVLILVDVQGLAYRECADLLAVPVGTVRSRLARARSMLQRSLWSQAVEAGVVAPAARAIGSTTT